MKPLDAFASLVSEAMARRGLSLRELCRRAALDPSLASKMLAGKRPPPSDEPTLRRLAQALEIDAVALIVAAGRIPSEWGSLGSDSARLRAVHALASGRGAPSPAPSAPPRAPLRSWRDARSAPAVPPRLPPPSKGLSEELL